VVEVVADDAVLPDGEDLESRSVVLTQADALGRGVGRFGSMAHREPSVLPERRTERNGMSRGGLTRGRPGVVAADAAVLARPRPLKRGQAVDSVL